MTDPYRILGVLPDADDAAIRAAYLAAIRACPPERDAARFERVRTAFEAVGTARARLAHTLFDTTVPSPADVLAALIDAPQPAPGPAALDPARLLRVLAAR
jgi:hypothetical protein